MKLTSNVDEARPFTTTNDHHDDGIVSRSPALGEALNRMERVAPTDTAVLLTGETGTGKELLARVVHRRSRRAVRPMVAVNLAAIPEALLASELFGHEQGAFTGASQRRIGRFEVADRGTLFLDEVGELSHDMQVALLRVLQEGEFERLGASQTRKVDVRLITATNRDLEQAVDDREFRADLYYRLSVFPIQLPPLRERREDIVLLAQYFLEQIAGRIGRTIDDIDPESVKQLEAYSWPGNIRQLQNVIEHSAILSDGGTLRVPAGLLVEKGASLKAGSRLDATLRKSELQMIEQALQETEGRVSGPSGAAARLGLPPATLESKIKRFNIDKLQFRPRAGSQSPV
jgi:transcriptional regulator with GAF, ATPase, and Fis domain